MFYLKIRAFSSAYLVFAFERQKSILMLCISFYLSFQKPSDDYLSSENMFLNGKFCNLLRHLSTQVSKKERVVFCTDRKKSCELSRELEHTYKDNRDIAFNTTNTSFLGV